MTILTSPFFAVRVRYLRGKRYYIVCDTELTYRLARTDESKNSGLPQKASRLQ